MRSKILIIFLLLCAPFVVLAQDNEKLTLLFEADQTARQVENKDWEKIREEDEGRRYTILSILNDGGIKTSKDYYHAAFIFQHGETKEEIRLAHAFATISAALDGETSAANWIQAASWDRLLLRFEQPQWYGTQYVKNESGNWSLYGVEPDVVTDEDRAAWSVPSLEKAKARLNTLNDSK